MGLMKELSFIFDIYIPNTEVFCEVFKENQSYISVAESNKFSPITKHITTKYHYFKALYKIKLLGYAVLIQEKKQRKFSLIHLTKHY